MNRETLLQRVAAALADVAPEVDLAEVEPDEDLREELDIDSMDFLKLLEGIHAQLGVQIPEEDYGQLETLDALLDYLAARA